MSQHADFVLGKARPRTLVLAAVGGCVLSLASLCLGDSPSDRQPNRRPAGVQVADGSRTVMYRLPPTRHFNTEANWKPLSVVIPPKLIAANSQIDTGSKSIRRLPREAKSDARKLSVDLNQKMADATTDFQKELEREFEAPPVRLPKPPVATVSPPPEAKKIVADAATPAPLDVTPIVEYAAPPTDEIVLAPAPSELTVRMLPSIRQAYALGQRGAIFASRSEFVAVLRRIATAKDIKEGTDQYSRALSDGLRALDEAEDLMPGGTQLIDMDLSVVASSHRTPVLKETEETLLPHQAAVLYHEYAQQKLAEAVAGEQAGSMALHGLGKLYNRESEGTSDDQMAVRNSMTMYWAALLAHPENHLAANELGVLLARNGQPEMAAEMFEQVIALEPNATAYHNLAVVQQKVGQTGIAAANEERAQAYASWESTNGAVSRRKGIRWVSPEQMAQAGGTEAPAPIAQTSAPASADQPMFGRNTQPDPRRMANVNTSASSPGQQSVAPEETPSTWEKFVNAATFGKLRTADNQSMPMGPAPKPSVRMHGHTSAGTMLR